MLIKNIARIALVTALMLLVPFLAMQFGTGVVWTLLDFVTAGVLLFGTGLVYELIARTAIHPTRRIVLIIVVTLALLLVWADLAVGIFNIPGFSGS